MIDIDHFKNFNDRYGHATGDRVLQTVAGVLKKAFRTVDLCARLGGEEFAVLLPDTPALQGRQVAERVRQTLAGYRYTGLGLPPEDNVTISVGVATCPRDATTLEDLLELADKALYAAKSQGRDRVCQHAADAAPQTVTLRSTPSKAAGRGAEAEAPGDEPRRHRAPVEQGVVERLERRGARPREGLRQAHHLALAEQVAHRLAGVLDVPSDLELGEQRIHERLARQQLHRLGERHAAGGDLGVDDHPAGTPHLVVEPHEADLGGGEEALALHHLLAVEGPALDEEIAAARGPRHAARQTSARCWRA